LSLPTLTVVSLPQSLLSSLRENVLVPRFLLFSLLDVPYINTSLRPKSLSRLGPRKKFKILSYSSPFRCPLIKQSKSGGRDNFRSGDRPLYSRSDLAHTLRARNNSPPFALPAVRVRFPARFFCQGRPLRVNIAAISEPDRYLLRTRAGLRESRV
jgi:hypothetical protein